MLTPTRGTATVGGRLYVTLDCGCRVRWDGELSEVPGWLEHRHPPTLVRVERDRHAAHDPYTGRPLHDLAWYHVRSETKPTGAELPPELPSDSGYHSGYHSVEGQMWLYYRREKPDRPTCDWCTLRRVT
jgi:hypothetical protein